MRNAFASAIHHLAREHKDVFLLYGDIGNKLFDGYKEEFPQRAINSGVAEANMVSVAAGLAKEGFKPFAYTINSFLYLKALEQIKLDVCYTDLPVTLVGTGAALNYSALGTTHHSLEDVGVLRNLSNLQIFSPSDPGELSRLIGYIYANSGPSYIRLGKKGRRVCLCTRFFRLLKVSTAFNEEHNIYLKKESFFVMERSMRMSLSP